MSILSTFRSLSSNLHSFFETDNKDSVYILGTDSLIPDKPGYLGGLLKYLLTSFRPYPTLSSIEQIGPELTPNLSSTNANITRAQDVVKKLHLNLVGTPENGTWLNDVLGGVAIVPATDLGNVINHWEANHKGYRKGPINANGTPIITQVNKPGSTPATEMISGSWTWSNGGPSIGGGKR